MIDAEGRAVPARLQQVGHGLVQAVYANGGVPVAFEGAYRVMAPLDPRWEDQGQLRTALGVLVSRGLARRVMLGTYEPTKLLADQVELADGRRT